MTLREFYHELTPDQIRTLHKHILARRLRDRVNQAIVTHYDPKEIIPQLEDAIERLIGSQVEPATMYNDEVFAGLNVNTATVPAKPQEPKE